MNKQKSQNRVGTWSIYVAALLGLVIVGVGCWWMFGRTNFPTMINDHHPASGELANKASPATAGPANDERVPREKQPVPLPTAEQQQPSPEVRRRLVELSATAQQTSPLVISDSYVAQQYQAERLAWYTRHYVDAYRRLGLRDARWDSQVEAFLTAAVEAIVNHELRTQRPPEFSLDSLRPLIEAGREAINLGCGDPLLLMLQAEMLTYSQGYVEARKLLGQASTGFFESEYPLETSYYALLLAPRTVGHFDERLHQHWLAVEKIIELLRHRPFDRLERRMLLNDFGPVVKGLLLQQPTQLATALRQGGGDPWLTKMLLGKYHAWLATDVDHYRVQAEDRKLDLDSPRAWKIAESHGRTAAALFSEAWLLEPDAPEAATELIRLSDLMQHSRGILTNPVDQTPRFWFDQAIAAQFDYLPAFAAYRQLLYQRGTAAGGKYDELLQFGRECLATGRFDTEVPDQFLAAAIPAVRMAGINRRFNEYPQLFDEFVAWYEGYHEQNRLTYRKSLLMGLAMLFERREEATRLLDELQTNVDAAALSQLQLRFADVRRWVAGREKSFSGHKGGIDQLCLAGDGNSLLGCAADGTVRTWSLDDGQQVRLTTTAVSKPVAWDVSDDGALAAVGDEGREITVWSTQTGDRLGRFDLPGTIRTLEFTSKGVLAVAAQRADGQEDEITMWRITDGEKLASLTGHSEPIHDLAFDPRTNRLASVAGRTPVPDRGLAQVEASPYTLSPAELVIWDLNTDEAVAVLKPFVHVMHRIEFSPNGKLLAIAGQDWSLRTPAPDVYASLGHQDLVRVLRADSWQAICECSGYRDVVTSLAFLDQGRVLATGSADRAIRMWDLATKDELAQLTGHGGRVRSLAAIPAISKLASADEDGDIKIWDFATSGIRSQAQSPLLEHSFGRLMAIGSSATGMLTCDQLHGVTLWNASGGFDSGLSFSASSMPFTYAGDVSPDGTTLATAGGTFDRLGPPARSPDDSKGGTILLWDIATGKLRKRISGECGTVFCLKFSPDGKSLASGSTDGDVIVWNVATGEPWRWGRLSEHFGAVTALCFSPDGKTLATGSASGTRIGQQQSGNFRIWDLPENMETAAQSLASRVTRDGYQRRVVHLTFSPNGDLLFTSSEKTVDVWDTMDFENKMSVPGSALAVSPDGNRLAAAGANNQEPTMVWETATGRELYRFSTDFRSGISGAAFTPDGRRLVVGTYGGQLAGWDLESGVELIELH
ncbi:MAG TPA: WD40 repeat domain-containing protein [Pirellulaceae bacterium]|nr:WD40 repeat domain-containing protein [Pirellulaceae bacterium]